MLDLERLIDQYHERINADEQPRPYLGCSIAGYRCERRIWLTFRWAIQDRPSGRTLRMFRRGRLEEETAIEDLQAIGCEIAHAQQAIFLTPHIAGHIDGVIVGGLPGFEREKFVLEIKTLSANAFRELKKKGLQNARPDHWAQVQLYMLGSQIPRCLYYAVCKDDDHIYTEIVKLDAERATRLLERLERLVTEKRLPPPISNDPTWWECKGCPAYSFCHEKAPVTARNCRTCEHSGVEAIAPWGCLKKGIVLLEEEQRAGCESHEFLWEVR